MRRVKRRGGHGRRDGHGRYSNPPIVPQRRGYLDPPIVPRGDEYPDPPIAPRRQEYPNPAAIPQKPRYPNAPIFPRGAGRGRGVYDRRDPHNRRLDPQIVPIFPRGGAGGLGDAGGGRGRGRGTGRGRRGYDGFAENRPGAKPALGRGRDVFGRIGAIRGRRGRMYQPPRAEGWVEEPPPAYAPRGAL